MNEDGRAVRNGKKRMMTRSNDVLTETGNQFSNLHFDRYYGAVKILPVRMGAPLSHSHKSILKKARRIGGRAETKLGILKQPRDVTTEADVVYTDVLVSMGQEKERQRRMRMLRRYQINPALLKIPADEIVVMRCIPAHGDQTTDPVTKVPQSLVCAQT
jgi:ornithine carbamoyltransferase